MHPSSFRALITALALIAAPMLVAEIVLVPTAVTNQNRLNDTDVLAEYNGGAILRSDLDKKISKIPPNAQGRYRTVEGQIQVLDIMAVEEAFMAKALQLGIDKEPEVAEKINSGLRQFYIQEFYTRNVGNLVVITEDDKRTYYLENKAAFYLFPNISINYLQAENEEQARLAIQMLNKGDSFSNVSDLYNMNTYVKGLKGVVKNIRLNGNIPGIGNDLPLENLIAANLEKLNSIVGPVQTSTGWHVFMVIEHVAGSQRDYSEVQPELDQRVRPLVERRILNELTDRIKAKYNVVIKDDLLAEIDLKVLKAKPEIESALVVTSSNPEISMSVKQAYDSFNRLSQQEQLFYTKGGGAAQLVEQELIRNLLFVEAKALNYEQYFQGNEEYEQMRRYFILNVAFRRLVLDAIKVSSEESRKYYDARLSEYTSPASRAIQVLWFKNEKTANRAWKNFKRAHKLNDEKRMQSLIAEYSTRPEQALLDNQYNNGVITGIGQDADFSKRIWDNPVGYLSPVFTTAKGEVVFFRTTKENPEIVKPFTEMEPRIFGILKKEKETSQQQKVSQELFEEFNLRKYPERIRLLLSAEELFNLADNSARNRSFNDAITFYNQIIQNYKNNTDDYKASFMKAFIIAEEMKNTDLALDLFKAFVKDFPTGDLHESAQFMIESLEGNIDLNIDGE
ncbi:MAG: peptidyl-prolyl cis-trans isomerase [Candidatus Cloacimonadaceae bacterium]|nr:peptidyl-prolyl cis-trans isomerase [Candidatus Cloacimonadaceae bacterium]